MPTILGKKLRIGDKLKLLNGMSVTVEGWRINNTRHNSGLYIKSLYIKYEGFSKEVHYKLIRTYGVFIHTEGEGAHDHDIVEVITDIVGKSYQVVHSPIGELQEGVKVKCRNGKIRTILNVSHLPSGVEINYGGGERHRYFFGHDCMSYLSSGRKVGEDLIEIVKPETSPDVKAEAIARSSQLMGMTLPLPPLPPKTQEYKPNRKLLLLR